MNTNPKKWSFYFYKSDDDENILVFCPSDDIDFSEPCNWVENHFKKKWDAVEHMEAQWSFIAKVSKKDVVEHLEKEGFKKIKNPGIWDGY